jgi:hydroxyethylthiazole kinase
MGTLDTIVAGLKAVREQRPLIHNITNYVAMNNTANALLALGASPVMAHAVEEVEEMASIARAVVLNIGTLSTPWIEAMFRAGRAARARGIPLVLDPVGAGATTWRTETARQLIQEAHPAVIRGNASEILALLEGGVRTHGVDSRHTVDQARACALRLAAERQTVVAVTGPEDFVTDGERTARIRCGHPLLARITGSGCMATAVIGALGAVQPDAYTAAVAGLVIFGIAGEMAATEAPRPGTFQVRLIDALDEIDDSDLRRGARVDEK